MRGKCGGGFLDDGGFEKIRFAGGGKSVADFGEAEIDNFLARLLEQIVRGADDQLQILAFAARIPVRACAVRACIESRLVEDPLSGGIEQAEERLGHHLAVEPEMHAGDGRDSDFVQIAESGVGVLDAFGEKFGKREMGKRQDEGVGGFLATVIKERSDQLAVFDAKAAKRRAKDNFAALLFDGRLQPS